jgi:chromosome segregation ATPase
MSRMPTVILALMLLFAVGWVSVPAQPSAYSAVVDAWLSERIAGALFDWFGDWNGDGFETEQPSFSYTEVLLRVAGLLAAAAIGLFAGARLKRLAYRRHEDEFKRQIYEAKARLPQLETSLRNRELAVTRLKMEVDEWEQKLDVVNRQLGDRDQQIRDRDRSITRLTSEIAMLRTFARNADENGSADSRMVILEEHSRALSDQAVDDEVMRTRLAELEGALADATQRLAAVERERDRQGKWLDVLNDQLAHARDANHKLSAGADHLDATRARIVELEREVARLKEELAERDRRLAASRFECANARTTLAHLKAELERRDGVITH